MSRDENLCPECGARMVSRVRQRDGRRFWSCSTYPECTGTRDTDGEPNRNDGGYRSPSERARAADRRRWEP